MKASSATARGGKHYLMRRSCEIEKPRHRQRQQPAQRPRSQVWKHVGRRLRFSRAQGKLSPHPGNKGRQRNPDPWTCRRRKQRRHTSQRSRRRRQRRNQSQKDLHRGSHACLAGQGRSYPINPYIRKGKPPVERDSQSTFGGAVQNAGPSLPKQGETRLRADP